MKRRMRFLTLLAAGGLLTTLICASFIYERGVLADDSTKDVAFPLWAVILGAVALLITIASFLWWATLHSSAKR